MPAVVIGTLTMDRIHRLSEVSAVADVLVPRRKGECLGRPTHLRREKRPDRRRGACAVARPPLSRCLALVAAVPVPFAIAGVPTAAGRAPRWARLLQGEGAYASPEEFASLGHSRVAVVGIDADALRRVSRQHREFLPGSGVRELIGLATDLATFAKHSDTAP
jgi:hypothetical protein